MVGGDLADRVSSGVKGERGGAAGVADLGDAPRPPAASLCCDRILLLLLLMRRRLAQVD
jgi:hypothetical protein